MKKSFSTIEEINEKLNPDSTCRMILWMMARVSPQKPWSPRELASEIACSNSTIYRHLSPHLRDKYGLVFRDPESGWRLTKDIR